MKLPVFAPEKTPCQNLRGPTVEDFAKTWAATERWAVDPTVRGYRRTWFLLGVRSTCRWLGCGTVPDVDKGFRLAPSPVLGRELRACPELIEEECDAVQEIGAGTRGLPVAVALPGQFAGIAFTLLWAWLGGETHPIDAYLEELDEQGL